jgi:argininosuccinate lyase
VPGQLSLIINNLPSGYFRDLQILKEVFLPLFDELNDCLTMATLVLKNIRVNKSVLDDRKYDYLFTVEEVNKLVLSGIPFREAYRQIAHKVEKGEFIPDKKILHTHEGSIGNLCLDKIAEKKQTTIAKFRFSKIQEALDDLLR